MHSAGNRSWHFFHSERGGVSVLFGLLSFVLVAAIGAAVDYSRWHSSHQKISAIMDGALLAAGRQYQTDPSSPDAALAAAQTYFNQAVASGIDVVSPSAVFNVVPSPMGVSGTVTGTVKTPFLNLMQIGTLPMNISAQVEFGIAGSSSSNASIEVSLMLDVTESMCDGGAGPCTTSVKMDAMKTAAKDLVNIVTASNTATPAARIALVPFSGRVRVDDEASANAGALMKKLTNLDPVWNGFHADCSAWTVTGGTAATSSETPDTLTWSCASYVPNQVNNWKVIPCVSDRTGPDEFTDAQPGPNSWVMAFEGTRMTSSWDSSDTAPGSETGTSAADPYYGWNYTSDGRCWDIQPANYILPLTGDKTVINARIDALDAYGPTGGALGTAWAWYMLSPNWSSIWTGASTPGPYADLSAISNGVPKLRKIAVLMTDGDYNTYRSWKGADPVMVANNAKAICANMKAAGVEVFTVGFDLDSLPAAEKARATDTLQTCGTDISHFYNSLNPAQLQTSFRDIALKLSQLYVSK